LKQTFIFCAKRVEYKTCLNRAIYGRVGLPRALAWVSERPLTYAQILTPTGEIERVNIFGRTW